MQITEKPKNALDELTLLEEPFLERHLGSREEDQQKMLELLGFGSLEDLSFAAVPADIYQPQTLQGLPQAKNEEELLSHMHALAAENTQLKSMIGMGFYNCYSPQVLIRNVLENPGWYTAYTPYQAEISQGRLEALANYQTMVSSLCGLDLSNASLLDGASACAEAMSLCLRMKKKAQRFFISQHCHLQDIAVVQLRAEHADIELIVGDENQGIPNDICGALLSYPQSRGALIDYEKIIEQLHQQKALAVLSCDLLSLCLLKSPGELGADIAVGSAQRFGQPLGFGGPHAAFIACRKDLQRGLPGRLIGVSRDRYGEAVYRMALQTREQHIRREKATSNICTAQALLAIIAGFYAVYHGPEGLKRIARRVHLLTQLLATSLKKKGIELANKHFFDTITLKLPAKSKLYLKRACSAGYNLRYIDADHLAISCDQTTKKADIQALLACFEETPLCAEIEQAIPESLQRQSTFLEHPVFHSHHSETEMMRYLRWLVNRDIALDRSMIPLGSCTMKLNAASEMVALSLPGFANIHPFVPAAQTQGYKKLIARLEQWLSKLTGYDAVSLQPNAGSQGEYAGLLAIKAWHKERGQEQRNICLIPISAHGTNPASAYMAGMKVVAVRCQKNGDIDIQDLTAKCEKYSSELAALMLTYPSTHGVFESEVRRVCEIIHAAGGQVYIDGANFNAQLGLAYPGKYGGDVSHLNLHKTFCIPHGGGGPGVGALAVKEHLKPFLPGHILCDNGSGSQGAVTSAAWGSASILTISYAYIALMGEMGLRTASQVAILAANYLAKRLEAHYPILYRGQNGLVAHEFILDIRSLEKETGVTSEDVAKRLMDYGFHAPTLSFPVPGTLMIEPTESEPLEELERFAEAMIAIRGEIEEIQQGKADAQDNLLKNAPHNAIELAADQWSHPYTREQAAYPLAWLKKRKVFPPVGRIDNTYGDRNLFCSCIPMEEIS